MGDKRINPFITGQTQGYTVKTKKGRKNRTSSSKRNY